MKKPDMIILGLLLLLQIQGFSMINIPFNNRDIISRGGTQPDVGKQAKSISVIPVTEFGANPDSGTDATPAVTKALEKIAQLNGKPVILSFPKGRYDFWAGKAQKIYCPITAVHQQWDFITAFYMNGLKNVTIEGNDSELIFHSRMTPIFINKCDDIEIRNISIDHSRPTISEFTVINIGDSTLDIQIHPDSDYKITGGKFRWVGADGDLWSQNPKLYQDLDVKKDITRRVNFNLGASAKEIGYRIVRFYYPDKVPAIQAGTVFQTRDDGIRNQQGSVVNLSRNIRWHNVNLYFCTGLGIVSQLTENLAFRSVNIEPRKGSGRTCASFADGFHCCNCTGKIIIENCRIVGTQDDPINVYGDDLIIKEMEKPDQLILSYSTWEQCGYLMFFPGDELILLRKQTLLPFARRRIVSAELIDKMRQRVVLDDDVPADCVGHVAENRTRMPEISIRKCYFARVPTRGLLVSSWKKTLIEQNIFFRTQMAAILVCHGDDPYFQQGAVEDLTIQGNTFIECKGGVFIQPDQPVVDKNTPLDKNIKVRFNKFIVGEIERPVFWARSTRNIRINKNIITVAKPGLPLVWLNGCSNVDIRNNRLEGDTIGIAEVVDFEPIHVLKDIIKTDKNWKVIKGSLRPGSK